MISENNSNHKNNRIFNIAKLVLAVFLVGYIIAQTNLEDFIDLWHRISVIWLVFSLIAFYLGIWVIARRYWVLLNGEITFRETLDLVILQTIIGNLIAMSAGVASYLTVLRGKHKVHLLQSVTILLVARLVDLLIVMIALIFSSLITWQMITPIRWIVVIILLGLVGLFVILCSVFILRHTFVEWIEKILYVLHVGKISLVRKLIRNLRTFANWDLHEWRRLISPSIKYAIPFFVLSFVYFYTSIRIFDISIPPFQMLFLFSLLQITILIPIQILGGLGVQDFTSVYLFGLFGVESSEISPVILGTRLLFILANAVLVLCLPLSSKSPSIHK